ncbi:histidine utilization repressor [Kaistia defluvii]|uniref:histidine utilization repressor n=1 Tax=Kaistia defluvii TaxID=410841 RepID=UPI002253B697|nr:histidine utilization repressor [Kaistia defluvii]MCX5517865.1 histidine utilization repressor [Kaistia defluvii]
MKTDKDPTLHQRILGEIEGNIVSGAWPPGYRIPFEIDLAAQYGVSRMTVNKVLTQLAKAGLVERRRRSGSFVRQPQAQSAVLEIQDIRNEVEQLGQPYRFHVESRRNRRARQDDRRWIDVAEGGRLLEVRTLHFAGPAPFCIEERLINLEAVPAAADASFEAHTPGQWLLDQVPWSSAEHRVQATGANAEIAALLDVAAGTACLVIERRTWSMQVPVTYVRFTYPGDRHTLVARFTPQS